MGLYAGAVSRFKWYEVEPSRPFVRCLSCNAGMHMNVNHDSTQLVGLYSRGINYCIRGEHSEHKVAGAAELDSTLKYE